MTNEEIVKLIQSGIDKSKNLELLYNQNERFITMIIKQHHYDYICHYRNRDKRIRFKDDNDEYEEPDYPIGVIEFDELLQEAFIGLCNAVKGYDAGMECTFLTYAAHWIRQAVKRYIENSGGVVRVPVHLQEKVYKYNQVTRRYISEFSREPTLQEYADWLNITVKEVVKLQNFMFRKEVMSLDAPLTADDDSDITIADSIADNSVNVEEQVVEEMVNEEVSKVWTEVARVLKNPTMKDVILYRFRDNMTLKEIADRIGMTSESVRHYEAKGLRRLRSDSRTKRLFAMIA